MSVVFILIFVLAVALIAVGIGLSRRDQRRHGAAGERASPAPVRPSAAPQARAPAAPVAIEPEFAGEIESNVEVTEAPRLRDRLGKTRAAFSRLRVRTLVDEETMEELEETLLLAD